VNLPKDRLRFFLGGHDLEMLAIRELLKTHGVPFLDHDLRWGAKASDYRADIDAALARGERPVLVELDDDLGLVAAGKALRIDHHGVLAGWDRQTSLEQVFELLQVPREKWTRRFTLVAANDGGHIRAMQAAGASHEEIEQIRASDREAQGVTLEDEIEAERAVSNHRILVNGRLTVLEVESNQTSAAADRMEVALGGPGYKNLLIFSPNALNFFGAGDLVSALNGSFPGGWFGGNLPEFGFWGISRVLATPEAVIDRVIAEMRGADVETSA
jgi:hypothetical protein